MQKRRLGGTALTVSRIGFGASSLGGAFGEIDPAEAACAVRRAIECGINLFDVSPYYGLTLAETRLGEALLGHRDRVVLSTKCGRYGADSFDFSPQRIAASIDESLRRLKTDYVDLLLAHDIEFWPLHRIVEETVPAMRRLQHAGKARYIGISGYPLDALTYVMDHVPVDAVLTYCHHNALVDDINEQLVPIALIRRVGIINASPFHMGVLAGHRVPPWHPADVQVKQAGVAFAGKCREFGLDPGAVALAIAIDHEDIASTLCGMATRAEVDANCAAFRLVIPEELALELAAIVEPVRDRVWQSGLPRNL
jgi:L-galactose dehydrogenase